MFWFFSHKAYGILASQPGTELLLPALQGKVLATGRPGKSSCIILRLCEYKYLLIYNNSFFWYLIFEKTKSSVLQNIEFDWLNYANIT